MAPPAPATRPASRAPLRVALLGVGTVGRAVAEALLADTDRLTARAGRPLKLVAMAARSRRRLDGLGLPPDVVLTDDPTAAATVGGVDVVVEVLGGLEPAGSVVLDGIRAGRAVVTANKHLLAARGSEIEAAALASGTPVRFEAAVGGGTPVLRLLAADLVGMHVERIRGVVNGTTNWILDRMELDGLDGAAALAAAQAAGYAEADPSLDLDGVDAADKLVILSRLAFGVWLRPEEVQRVAPDGPGAGGPGISAVSRADIEAAARRGRRVRLVAEAGRSTDRDRSERGGEAGVEASVLAREVDRDDPLASASGVGNVIVIEGAPHGVVTVSGPGAGGPATAAAVIADLVAIAHGEGSTWDASPLTHRAAEAAPVGAAG
jgi:homoserine dehydrogenase